MGEIDGRYPWHTLFPYFSLCVCSSVSLTFSPPISPLNVCSALLGSISSTFYKQLLRQYSCAKKLQSQTASTKSFRHKIIGAKAARKMLMKLTAVLFNNTSISFRHSLALLLPPSLLFVYFFALFFCYYLFLFFIQIQRFDYFAKVYSSSLFLIRILR